MVDMPRDVCRDQMTALWSHSSLFIFMWISEIKLRPLGLFIKGLGQLSHLISLLFSFLPTPQRREMPHVCRECREFHEKSVQNSAIKRDIKT